jgi:hypothetical protein
LGNYDDAAGRPRGRSRLVQTLDMVQLALVALLVLVVSVFVTLTWPI